MLYIYGFWMGNRYHICINLPGISFKREIDIIQLVIYYRWKYDGWFSVLGWSNNVTFHFGRLIIVEVFNWWSNITWNFTCYKSIDSLWQQHLCWWWVICGYSPCGTGWRRFLLQITQNSWCWIEMFFKEENNKTDDNIMGGKEPIGYSYPKSEII